MDGALAFGLINADVGLGRCIFVQVLNRCIVLLTVSSLESKEMLFQVRAHNSPILMPVNKQISIPKLVKSECSLRKQRRIFSSIENTRIEPCLCGMVIHSETNPTSKP